MSDTVQDLLMQDLFSDSSNETVEILDFMRGNAIPLTDAQVQAVLLLKENGLDDIASYAVNIRPNLVSRQVYFDTLNKLTLADRIKGNAKLSGILKANANPANAMSQPKDMK